MRPPRGRGVGGFRGRGDGGRGRGRGGGGRGGDRGGSAMKSRSRLGSKFQHQKSNVAVVDLWRSFSNYAGNGNGNDKENVAGVLETTGDLKPKFQGEKRAIQP
ncbi:hypothetical protein PVK06_043089 [Gossypium arboreum]|uniref:Uncharacterized protein n=1 Tax=Gossypium arboreum TaxID=29729 RepID=A0ABR0MQ30_GOSAR|nr:hypothetical protein PVK06_043089 [Gossypium arboreum]